MSENKQKKTPPPPPPEVPQRVTSVHFRDGIRGSSKDTHYVRNGASIESKKQE